MSEHSPFDAAPDAELGTALREALAMPFGAAFAGRVRARLKRQRNWDDELAGWLWQGLVAASLVTVLAGWGLQAIAPTEETEVATATAPNTVAGQLLEGSVPGTTALLASMTARENP